METKEYQRLVNLYLDMVYRVALNGCKNTYDADDVVQDTFMKLLKCRKPFDSDEHIRNWLIRVTINECKRFWTSPWKTRIVPWDENVEEPVVWEPEQSALYDKVMELSPKYRETVYLYYFEDFSVKEIADILTISETAVQTRLQRARQKLKKVLGGDEL